MDLLRHPLWELERGLERQVEQAKLSRRLKRERDAVYREERGVPKRLAYRPAEKWYDV